MSMSKVEKDLRESLDIIEGQNRLFEDEAPEEFETEDPIEEDGDLICPSCDSVLMAEDLQFQEDEDQGIIISQCPECGEVFGLDEETAHYLFGEPVEEGDDDELEESTIEGDPRYNIIRALRQSQLNEDVQENEGDLDEAWRVRHGKKIRKKRKKKHYRTAKQKMAIKKARRKAWTSKAKKWRTKSLKILRKFAEDEVPYEADYYEEPEEMDEDTFMDVLDEMDEDELYDFFSELDEDELGEVQDLYERRRRILGGRVSYRPTKMRSRVAKRRFRMSSAMRRALKRARSRIKSSSRRRAVRSRRKGFRMGLYRR